MDAESVLRLVREYDMVLTRFRADDPQWYARRPECPEAHRMCIAMLQWDPSAYTADKYHRWLGFIQGLLFAADVRTIDEMRDDVRRYSHTDR